MLSASTSSSTGVSHTTVSKDIYQPLPQQQEDRDSFHHHHTFSSLLSPMAPAVTMDSHMGKSTSSSLSRHHHMSVSDPSSIRSSSNHLWNHTEEEVTPYTNNDTQPRWNDHSNTYTNSWATGAATTSVIGSQLEVRETSQHSRSDERRSSGSNNSNIWGTSDPTTTLHQGAPPQIHGSNTDEFSKSSHTSTTSTVLLFQPTSTTSSSHGHEDAYNAHNDDDIDVFHDVSSYQHRSTNKGDPVLESSRFLSSLQLQSTAFDHHQYSNEHDSVVLLDEQKKNQPPKQPVRRPSYGYNNPSLVSSSSISSSNNNDQYPLFVVPNSHSHDSNSSSNYSSSQQPQYTNRTTADYTNPSIQTSSYYGGSSDTYGNSGNMNRNAPPYSKPSSLSSALQKAANANPYYPTNNHMPASSHSVTSSSIPGLMNAHSGSVTTTKTSGNQSSTQYSSAGTLYPPPPVVISSSSSSLAVAAASTSFANQREPYHPRQSHTNGSLMMFGGPPPPGFIEQQQDATDDTDDFGIREVSRPHSRKLSSAGRVEPPVQRGHSPPALKDRNANLPQYHNNRSFGQLSGGGDIKDDMHSVTSTTTATTAASLRSYQVPQQQSHHQRATSTGKMESSMSSSQALRVLMDNTLAPEPASFSISERRQSSSLLPSSLSSFDPGHRDTSSPILPQPVIQDDYFLSSIEQDMERHLQRQTFFTSSSNINDDGYESLCHIDDEDFDFINDDDQWSDGNSSGGGTGNGSQGNTSIGGVGDGTLSSHHPTKKREWLHRMNRKLNEIPVGELDATTVPVLAIMNAWAKTKSAQGAAMVELWLKRAQEEYDSGNRGFVPTTKMYTMAGTLFVIQGCIDYIFRTFDSHISSFLNSVDAWARSGEGGAAAQRAEALLQHMHELYQAGGHNELRPTNDIFNAVINSWARSREKIAPVRAEQILNWMQNLSDLDIHPDKYTFNTVIHAWAKAGGTESATKAQELLARMHKLYQEGNAAVKPDTISYNVVINAWAKSGGKGALNEAEKLLARMHRLHEMGDPDVKPNVVTYGAVIDSFAKSGERGAAARADALLANMIQLHQADPVKHADLLPNTYVFNTVINCWAKSKEHDAASKAEEMLVAMSRLHSSGMPSLKPDNFTYTAVIDAWAKSGYRGAAARADQLLDKMEAKYLAGDPDLKPNSYTYNAVICALAKSGEAGAAARAERVLQNMVNRHRVGGDDDIKPTVCITGLNRYVLVLHFSV